MIKVKFILMPMLASLLALGGVYATALLKSGFKAPMNSGTPCTATTQVPDVCANRVTGVTCTIVIGPVNYDLFADSGCTIKLKYPVQF